MAGGFVFTHALRDFARGRRLLVWLFIAALVYGIGLAYARVDSGGDAEDRYVLLSAVLSYRVLALASAIFAMAVVAQEVEGKTIVYLLTRPIPRQALLLGRALAASIMVFVVTAFCAVAVSLATRGPQNPLLAKDLIALAVGSLAYTGLFTLVSLVLNRAMVACLLFAFGWETLAAGVPGDLKLMTLNTHVMALAERPLPKTANKDLFESIGSMLGSTDVSSGVAWIVLVLVIGFTLAASMAWFSHFEYTAREDAE